MCLSRLVLFPCGILYHKSHVCASRGSCPRRREGDTKSCRTILTTQTPRSFSTSAAHIRSMSPEKSPAMTQDDGRPHSFQAKLSLVDAAKRFAPAGEEHHPPRQLFPSTNPAALLLHSPQPMQYPVTHQYPVALYETVVITWNDGGSIP